MSNADNSTGSGAEAIIFTTGVEISEKFRKYATINDTTIAQANKQFQKRKGEFETSLLQDIHSTQQYFSQYCIAYSSEMLTRVKRLVLGIKSGAGMAEHTVISEIATLLFELFDDGYDMQNSKVLESVSLYLNTMEDLMTGQLTPVNQAEIDILVGHFSKLNSEIR